MHYCAQRVLQQALNPARVPFSNSNKEVISILFRVSIETLTIVQCITSVCTNALIVDFDLILY